MRWCSGALINNTARDFRSYLLTAFHCLDFNGDGTLSNNERNDVNNWLFRFGYESNNCGGTEGTNHITFNGANFRAAYQPTDVALLELFNNPTIGDCVTYGGWSKSEISPSSGVGIHHPAGDVKKISSDNDVVGTVDATLYWADGTSSPPSSHLSVDFDEGTTHGGSSGSPLFDQNHRIVGQLHGGENGCPPVYKYYGRFSVSWTGGGTNDTRLSNWLDPINSGTLFMETEVPAFISGPDNFCTSETYSVTNLPSGSIVTWSVSGNLTISGSNTANPVTINGSGGNGTLSGSVTSACGSVALTPKQIITGTPIPDPIQGPTSLCPGDVDYFSIPAVTGASYNWDMDYELELASYTTPATNQIFVRAKAGFTGGYVYLTLTNPCGASGRISYWVGMGSSCSYFYSYSPNPANNELNITYREPSLIGVTTTSAPSTEIKKQFEVVLFNEKVEKLRVAKNNGSNNIKLDVQDIPNGTYYLHITDGKQVIRKQVIIKH